MSPPTEAPQSQTGPLLVVHDRDSHRARILNWAQRVGVPVCAPSLPGTEGMNEQEEREWLKLPGKHTMGPLGLLVHANYGVDQSGDALAPGDAVRVLLGASVPLATTSVWYSSMLRMKDIASWKLSCPVVVVTGGRADESGWDELNVTKHERLRWLSLQSLERCLSWEAVLALPAVGESPSLEQLVHKLTKRLRRLFRKLNDLREGKESGQVQQILEVLQGNHRKPPLVDVLRTMEGLLPLTQCKELEQAVEDFVQQPDDEAHQQAIKQAGQRVFDEILSYDES